MARNRGIVKIDGVEKTLTALGGRNLYQKAMQVALKRLSEIGRREAERRAPSKTGALKAALAPGSNAVRSFPIRDDKPLTASVSPRVDLTGRAAKGRPFRYPFALNASKKVAYKYRSGGPVGRRTRGWWDAAFRAEKKAANATVAEVAREIEKNFARMAGASI